MALFVTLIPTTIGALLSAIGIAGMDRLVRFNVLAMSGRAVEAAGDVDTLLLDKTGTITLGNRQATELIAMPGVDQDLADAAQLSSFPDETPEGRSIVVLVKEKYGLRAREMEPMHAQFVAFTAQTRMSGVDVGAREIRKGAVDAIVDWVKSQGGRIPPELERGADTIAKGGGTPLAVAENGRVLGLVPPQGHRQGRHPRALRRAAPDGHPHGDDHRRQPADRGRDRRQGPGSTTSWRRRRPRPSSS